MDDFLDALHKLVHEAVKRLKMGESGTVQCSKQYPEIEVRQYAMAYAMHKNKWFELKYDKAGDVVHVTRVEVPSFETTDQIDEEEER
jgi:uncharacterized protein (DUF2249 family)